MELLKREAPPANADFRQAVYRGEIFLLPPTSESLALVERMRALLVTELGADMREAQFRLGDEGFFPAIGRLRKLLYEQPEFCEAMRSVAAGLGFRPDENAFDPLRLRVIAHGAHENPQAAPVYYTHRDTWYSHPQCQISFWVPLHDLAEEETFLFYPDYLRTAVTNDSGGFDYDEWTRDRRSLRVGWQDRKAGQQAFYPAFLGELDMTTVVPFSCRAGEILVFTGAHLHRTRENRTGRTRFSVDFRTVHLGDHAAGLGAPNADNRSTGSALRDYFHPSTTALQEAAR